jgi:hypothetical protein
MKARHGAAALMSRLSTWGAYFLPLQATLAQ